MAVQVSYFLTTTVPITINSIIQYNFTCLKTIVIWKMELQGSLLITCASHRPPDTMDCTVKCHPVPRVSQRHTGRTDPQFIVVSLIKGTFILLHLRFQFKLYLYKLQNAGLHFSDIQRSCLDALWKPWCLHVRIWSSLLTSFIITFHVVCKWMVARHVVVIDVAVEVVLVGTSVAALDPPHTSPSLFTSLKMANSSLRPSVTLKHLQNL